MRYVADLEQHGEKVLLASGGKPGLGNLNVGSRRIGTVSGKRDSLERDHIIPLKIGQDESGVLLYRKGPRAPTTRTVSEEC